MFAQQLEKVKNQNGFIAALDQSGGSTPKALKLYGVEESNYNSNEEMFSLVHAMRTRIITSHSFNGDRILGAILFEDTLNRDIKGLPSAQYLWQQKQVVPFLKVDKGLEEEASSVQLMKPMPELDALLEHARTQNVFGTKMRSVIKDANPEGIRAIVQQQFEIGKQILAADLVPILEPEVDIHSPNKKAAEELLKTALLSELDKLDEGQPVMLKLTLPEEDNHYQACVQHPRVLKVVALSGGYGRDEANARTTRNQGIIASFSRALTEGLSAQQSDDEFNSQLDTTIESIFQASRT